MKRTKKSLRKKKQKNFLFSTRQQAILRKEIIKITAEKESKNIKTKKKKKKKKQPR